MYVSEVIEKAEAIAEESYDYQTWENMITSVLSDLNPIAKLLDSKEVYIVGERIGEIVNLHQAKRDIRIAVEQSYQAQREVEFHLKPITSYWQAVRHLLTIEQTEPFEVSFQTRRLITESLTYDMFYPLTGTGVFGEPVFDHPSNLLELMEELPELFEPEEEPEEEEEEEEEEEPEEEEPEEPVIHEPVFKKTCVPEEVELTVRDGNDCTLDLTGEAYDIVSVTYIGPRGSKRTLRQIPVHDNYSIGWSKDKNELHVKNLPEPYGKIRVDYYAYLTIRKHQGEKVFNLPEEHHEVILKGLLTLVAQKEEDIQRKRDFSREYEQAKEQMAMKRIHAVEPWREAVAQAAGGDD